MKTADIVSKSDVAGALQRAFETEVSNRGFYGGCRGGDQISVTLNNFRNQFTLGFFSAEAPATIGINVTVKQTDGAVAYNQYSLGQSKIGLKSPARITLGVCLAQHCTTPLPKFLPTVLSSIP